METRGIRLPQDLWEKLDWFAAANKLTRPEALRFIVSNATRDTRPPEPHKTKQIEASDAEWLAWEDAAKVHGVSVDQLMRHLMRGIVKRTFGTVPKE